MPLVWEDVGDVTIVRFIDCAILGKHETTELLALLNERDQRQFLVDLHNVDSFSSAALGNLISATRKLADIGAKLSLCHVKPRIHEVLTLTKMDKVFTILKNGPDEEDEQGVASRLIPPKPAGEGSVILPLPPSELQ